MTTWRGRSAAVGLCVALGALVAPAAVAATPAYVTPIIAHTAWTATESCRPVTGVVTLPDLVTEHASRGLSLTGTVVTSWIVGSRRRCIESLPLEPFPKPIQLPSWNDLTALRSGNPGFDLVSGSVDYADMTKLTPEQQKAEACDSRDVLVAHGVTAPLPLFAYPNNEYTTEMNGLVRTECGYRLGRRYANKPNTRTSVHATHFLNVYSINGGRCTDTTLPCSQLETRFPYTNPSTLAQLLHPAPGTWVAPQFYRLVQGAKSHGRLRWNCLGPAASHYTFDTGGDSTELYCADDYYAALANEPGYVRLDLTIGQVETLWNVP